MFLENDYARPLFDFEKGGPPKAFECLVLVEWTNKDLHEILGRSTTHPCGKITRTERGMRMHLKRVHNWEEQPCLYSTEHPEEAKNGEPRRLRAGAPNLNQRNETAAEDTEKTLPSQKSAEMNEGESLKPMNGGN